MKKDPFKEYIKESEPDKRMKGYVWHTAIGLQAVDGLQTSEYLTHTAVRNEEHPLYNRTLHISGAFQEIEKANIENEKPNIGGKKANIDAQKANMGDTFTPITARQILTLFHTLGEQEFFGRSDIQKAIGLKPTRASELLRSMVEYHIVESVRGHGKGKYHFTDIVSRIKIKQEHKDGFTKH